jgi:hypothetical protein
LPAWTLGYVRVRQDRADYGSHGVRVSHGPAFASLASWPYVARPHHTLHHRVAPVNRFEDVFSTYFSIFVASFLRAPNNLTFGAFRISGLA